MTITPHDTALEAARYEMKKSSLRGDKLENAITAYLAALPVDEPQHVSDTNVVEIKPMNVGGLLKELDDELNGDDKGEKLTETRAYNDGLRYAISLVEKFAEPQPFDLSIVNLARARYGYPPFVAQPQPMSEGERAELVEKMGDALYGDAEMELQDWRSAGGDRHYYPVITNEKELAAAALAHIEANYHLVKKDK